MGLFIDWGKEDDFHLPLQQKKERRKEVYRHLLDEIPSIKRMKRRSSMINHLRSEGLDHWALSIKTGRVYICFYRVWILFFLLSALFLLTFLSSFIRTNVGLKKTTGCNFSPLRCSASLRASSEEIFLSSRRQQKGEGERKDWPLFDCLCF